MNYVKTVIMTITTLIIILLAFPHTALAAESEFTPRLTAPDSGSAYYNSQLNVFSQCGYGMPNCTAYAYGRIYEITGEAPKITRGSAGDWWYINIRNGYYEYGSEPRPGAIACWSNHVAVVEAVDGDTITISQSHWHGAYFDTDTVTDGAARYTQTFYGYIYACTFEDAEDADSTKYKLEKAQYVSAGSDAVSIRFGEIISSCLNEDAESAEILINSLALRNIFQ